MSIDANDWHSMSYHNPDVDYNPDDEVVTVAELRDARITARGPEWIPCDYAGGEDYDDE